MQQAIDILEKLRNKVILRWGPNDTDATRLAELSLLSEIMKEFKSRGDGWIPVTERLPEYQEKVLLIDSDGRFSTGYMLGDNYWCASICNTFTPTHWMPLPLPPKQ